MTRNGAMDRTTSMGLWRYANEFCEAAELVKGKKGADFVPSYHLICHSIELALKAFLRGSGKDLNYLKKELGHNLKKILCEAKMNGISTHVCISQELENHIKAINPDYMDKQFEYIKTGTKTLPEDIDILIEGTRKIIQNIEDFCYQKRKLHYKTK